MNDNYEMIQGELEEIFFLHQVMVECELYGIKKEIPFEIVIEKGFISVENGKRRTDIIYKNDDKYTFDEYENYLVSWKRVVTANSVSNEKIGIVFDDYESATKALTKVLMLNKPFSNQIDKNYLILSEKYPEAMV